MIVLKQVRPPKMKTGTIPKFSTIDVVSMFVKLPVDPLRSSRLLATPRFSGTELFAARVVLRILNAPKLIPIRKRTGIIDA